jgi:enamine deaminase RidA (YjgF/YER057c/UK114 family)
MANRIVNTPELGEPVGYAHAVVADRNGRTVYLGGQTALGPDGTIVGTTLAEQLDVAAGNVMQALRTVGGEAEDIVSVQIFVTDPAEYRKQLGALGRVWQRHFGRHYPASGLFGVTRLFDDPALIELMCIAVVPEERLR